VDSGLTLTAARVLHVAAGNLFGGVETFLVTLARYRDRVPQLESEFALCFDGRLASELRQGSAPVHELGNARLRDPFSVLSANLAFVKLLRTNRYDAVVTHGAWPHALVGLSAKLMGVKLVTWGHGAPLHPGPLDRIADRIRPDLVIVNSRHTVEALGPLFRGVPNRVVYYPVEPRAAQRRPRAEVRRELRTSESSVVIAFAARFERWKGHDLLLRSARALLDRTSSDWCIWLCGGVQRPSEKAYLAELENYVALA
jgi:glycosyltransferase involved in cell wall biosynthesis